MEIRHGDLPPLVFDCGTGARLLGQRLVSEQGRKLHLFFSHFHMDHVFGFPFFLPIYTPGYQIDISVPAYSEDEARERLGRYLNGVYHPTRLRDLPSELSFSPMRPGREYERSGYTIRGLALNHPGGSMGYRVDAGGQSICYITDTAPFARPGEGISAGQPAVPAERKMLEMLDGVDVVIYDTMYDLAEYLEKMTWGHSYPEYAVALAREAGVKHLVLFHHAPEAADEQLDALAERWSKASSPRVTLAREGGSVNAEG